MLLFKESLLLFCISRLFEHFSSCQIFRGCRQWGGIKYRRGRFREDLGQHELFREFREIYSLLIESSAVFDQNHL
jgi:hypothetical protein